MFLQVCVLGLLAAITSGLLLYQESQRSRRAADRQLAHEELLRLNDFVETLVLSRQRSTATVSYAANIERYLLKPSPQATAAMNTRLRKLRDSLAVSAIYVLDETGLTLASSDYNETPSHVGQNFQTRDYFRQSLLGLPAQEIDNGRLTGRFGAYYSYPIIGDSAVGGDSSRFLGALVIKDSFKLPLLGSAKKEIAALKVNTVSVVNMVGPGGRIVASNRDGWIGKVLAGVPLSGKGHRRLEFEGATYTATSVELQDFPGWHLLRLQPTRHWLVDTLSPLMTQTGGLYLLLLCAVMVGMIGFYRRAAVSVRKRELAHKRLRRSHQRYRELSCRDALTGLYNRRAYQNDLAREIQRAQRYGHPLSVALLDIDFFKKINDLHGHETGDRVLRQIAKLIRDTIREADMAYRFGGEEFIVVLPETDSSAAETVIKRIQKALLDSEANAEEPIGFPVTFSCGIAAYQQNDTARELFERADALLYRVKANGRNGVRVQD
ncbi:diguanylate cyclase [Pseudomonas lopnurensis]|uniref:diguanylate cyclase n=1 Tax=Pseudomonas lopnurensis TaxID=1477517 RepID=UPI0028B0D8BF|nr:diguanylate cyclase [Pseudomonas lopnurensis]